MVAILAVACGWLAPAMLRGAQTDPQPARKDAAAGTKARAAQLLQEYRDSLVLIEGKTGNASGFIADIKGRKYLVSNAHVLADIKTPRFKLLDNSPLKLGSAMVAIGYDLFMVNVLEGGKGIPTVSFGATEAQFGDAVVVPGNAGGESVVSPLQGEIVGIGTDRIEITAPIEPGSSGSPIIDLRSGKAIGVAAYLRISLSLSRSREDARSGLKVRRFGYRLGIVQRWQVVDWTRFYAEADMIRNIQNTSDELVAVFWDIGSTSRLRPGRHAYESRAINSAVDRYYLALSQRPADAAGAAETLVASLRTVSQAGIVPRRRFTYDFFQRQFEQEEAKRKEIATALDKVLGNLN